MNQKTYLFKNSINKMLDLINELPEGHNIMPNDIELTKILNISRTTVRACVEDLINKQLVKRDGVNKLVLRAPKEEDYYEISEEDSTKDVQIEKFFLNMINTGQLLPGDRFSELSLAKKSGCTTITVREFLIKFSNTGLIEKIPRGRWVMVKFDETFVKELIDFRAMIEMRALTELFKLSEHHSIWTEIKTLLDQHLELRSDFENRFQEFPKLDSALHCTIQRCSKNRFSKQFFETISFVCHYHYQWDKMDKKSRYKVAIDEHIDLLNNIMTHNNAGAVMSMEKHMRSAETTLLRCVEGLNN